MCSKFYKIKSRLPDSLDCLSSLSRVPTPRQSSEGIYLLSNVITMLHCR
nr:MAG TPA: hypothetical protein [Caudoviricetes sp.]